MSLLTPEEQVGFHRQKGMKVLYTSSFFIVFGIVYFIWFGPWLRDAPGGTRVNAILYAYYELFGVTVGALVIAAFGLITSLFSYKHFAKAKEIKNSIDGSTTNP